MKILDAGKSGDGGAECYPIEALDLEPEWETFFSCVISSGSLKPVQYEAFETYGILESRKNVLVCAPTNSGKSLIGYSLLFEALRAGCIAVLLVPLRVLAREKVEELRKMISMLPKGWLEKKPVVRMSTGDVRLEGSHFSSPPEQAEILVATPERMDAILREPDYQKWTDGLGCVVVDEAHLISDKRRGPVLELLLASLLSFAEPPRLCLLSATIGEPETLSQWLRPCELIQQNSRVPALSKKILALENAEEADEVLLSEIAEILSEPEHVVLLFVYRRADTVKMVKALSTHLKQSQGKGVVEAFHAGMSIHSREDVRKSIEAGRCRCVVATTSLAMGVNLPVTHVLIRDTTFYGNGRLEVDALLQMLGRAGRGEMPGVGLVLVRPEDLWAPDALVTALEEESCPPIRSSFHRETSLWNGAEEALRKREYIIAELVASCLARRKEEGMEQQELETLLSNTLASETLSRGVPQALSWLSDPFHALAYQDESQRFHLTVLGAKGVRSVLPLGYTAGIGQLFRDLLSLEQDDDTFVRWAPFDQLLLMSLLHSELPIFRRFSKSLVKEVDDWFAGEQDTSVLFTRWIFGGPQLTQADALLGSMGIFLSAKGKKKNTSVLAFEKAYLATAHVIAITELCRGEALTEVSKRWKMQELVEGQEKWRDTALWLLSGHAKVFELRCFYHHLLESCSATRERIHRVKGLLGKLRHQVYALQKQLKSVR